MDTQNSPKITPLGYSIEQITKVIPIGRSSIYKLIKNGDLKTVIICGRRIVPASEIDRIFSISSPFGKIQQEKSIIKHQTTVPSTLA